MRIATRAVVFWCCLTAGGPLVSGAAFETTPPTWAKADHFWFRKAIPGGHLWLTVDAEHGVKEPLFDHQRLAIELSLRTGLEFTPLALPLADPAAEFVVKYDGSNAYIQQGAMAIEFILDGYHWRCDLQIKWNWNLVPPTDYECLSRRPVAAGHVPGRAIRSADTPVVSPDGRWEALVENHNVVIRPAGGGPAKALTTEGSLDAAWQPGSLRWSADSRGLTGYRVHADVWRADSINANVKALIAKSEWKVGS